MNLDTYTFVKPRLTIVHIADIRLPQPSEVILARGITEREFRSRQLGTLVLESGVQTFDGSYTPWHYDYTNTQLHLTTVGRCCFRLASLVSTEVPTPDFMPELIPALQQNALELEPGVGDMVIFDGYFRKTPNFHQVESLTPDRVSLVRSTIGY